MRVLETERLALRWFGEDDAVFIRDLLNDPGWLTNIGDRNVRTADEARVWIAEKLVANYWRQGFGLWAIERRTDGVLVGMGGLVDRDSLPDIDVGYALAPQFRGEGYAREAARACLAYARDVLGKSRVLAIVWPENAASIRVLEGVGMVAEGVRLLAGDPREAAVFHWDDGEGERRAAREPKEEIDALARRFFAAFSNRSGLSRVASVPSMFLPDAVITVVKPEAPRGVETTSVRAFVTPRAELLQGGRLIELEENETASRTEVTGRVAHRSSRYEKAGRLDGTRFQGGGNKEFQLVETARGWRIAALAWEDDR